MIGQLMQPSGGSAGVNPFGDVLGLASNLVGGPTGGQGTVTSLPYDLLKGVEGIITGDDIVKDTLGLAKPIESLGMKGLSGVSGLLGNLNPFGEGAGGEGGSGRLGGIIPYHYLPFLAAGAYGAWKDEQRMKRGEQVG